MSEKAESLLSFMKEEISRTHLPWVSWSKLLENADRILGKEVRHPIAELWSILEPITFTLAPREREPKAKNPRIYEYRIGNAWVYFPARMIHSYVESKES